MALFTRQGIDQAINALHCQPETLRAQLLERLRSSYTSEDLDQLTQISASDLIEELWNVHSTVEIKEKRKNLSGLKSSLNKALKTAITNGDNPEGIIIGKENVFVISDEKKDSLIEKLSFLGGKDSIADILGAVQALIKESIDTEHIANINQLIQQLDNTKEILTNLGESQRNGDTNLSEIKEEQFPGNEFNTIKQREDVECIEEDEVEEIEEEINDEWDNVEIEENDDIGNDGYLTGDEENEVTDAPDDDIDFVEEEIDNEWDDFEIEDDNDIVNEVDLTEDEENRNTDAPDDDIDFVEEEIDNEWDDFKIEDDNDIGNDNSGEDSIPDSSPLSQYIEPQEALDLGDVLQESNEEYVKQILDRFMPKFIKIPAGSYSVGAQKKRSSDRPTQSIKISSFFIGQHPITNDIFDFFIRETGYITNAEKEGYGIVTSNRMHEAKDKATGHKVIVINQGTTTVQRAEANWMHPCGPESSLEHKGNHPVVQVSIQDAMAFAAWAGKRLPTEDEWEIAARGKESFLYPWGDQYKSLANLTTSQLGTTSNVGMYGRLSLSPFGLLDMIGNIAEWTSSTHNKNAHLVITKGGSWANENVTCAQRAIETKETWSNTIGFRCCVNNPG